MVHLIWERGNKRRRKNDEANRRRRGSRVTAHFIDTSRGVRSFFIAKHNLSATFANRNSCPACHWRNLVFPGSQIVHYEVGASRRRCMPAFIWQTQFLPRVFFLHFFLIFFFKVKNYRYSSRLNLHFDSRCTSEKTLNILKLKKQLKNCLELKLKLE